MSDFTCAECKRPLTSYRLSANDPWVHKPCYHCVTLPQLQADVARRRALGRVVVGIDLDRALDAYRKLPPFKGHLGRVKLEIVHRLAKGTRGSAWCRQRRIRLAVGPEATPERVLEVLVHEMVHLALPDRVGHGERYRLAFRRACLELWGIDVPLDATPIYGIIAYGMGDVLTEKLGEKIARGEVDLFPPVSTAQAPKPTRSERMTALVEKRATHAAKMLARAEKRAQTAQKLLTKWRAKMNYYERQAARKTSGAESAD